MASLDFFVIFARLRPPPLLLASSKTRPMDPIPCDACLDAANGGHWTGLWAGFFFWLCDTEAEVFGHNRRLSISFHQDTDPANLKFIHLLQESNTDDPLLSPSLPQNG